MRDYMKEYIEKIDKIIEEKKINNKEELLSEHLVKIQFFQHERLIHFLVTMLFAIMFLMTFLYSLNNFNVGLIILNVLLLCLLVPYIFHYYYLENSVQYMYKQYDMLKNSK